jgi:hypothetical protein
MSDQSSSPEKKEPIEQDDVPSPDIRPLDTRRRQDSVPEYRIAFSPDAREKIRRDDITTLPLSRTFSRNSYSSASDEKKAQLKRVTGGKSIEPQAILPIGMFPMLLSQLQAIEH